MTVNKSDLTPEERAKLDEEELYLHFLMEDYKWEESIEVAERHADQKQSSLDINGQGTYTWSDGSTYEGEWNEGKMNGQGKFTWYDSSTYEGEWKDGKRDGTGKRTWADGSIYEGEYVRGQRSRYRKEEPILLKPPKDNNQELIQRPRRIITPVKTENVR